MLRIEGLGTALVTPFRDGAVDYASYEALVRRQVAAGVDFLVPLGSTAETPCLEDDEKVRLLDMTRQLFSGPVVAGVGTNSLQATLRNIRLLEPYGADAWLVVVPYYNKPTQEGMYQYFKAVAESTDKAVILYNVPGRTGSNIKPETVLRLTRIPNIIAIKEASGDVNQILKIRREAPADFTVLSGNDDQTLPRRDQRRFQPGARPDGSPLCGPAERGHGGSRPAQQRPHAALRRLFRGEQSDPCEGRAVRPGPVCQ